MEVSLKHTAFTLLLIGSVFLALWCISYFLVTDLDRSFIATNSLRVAIEPTFNQSEIVNERIIYCGDPSYLTELPILDGKLFVNHSDDFLLFGDVNIE